MVCLTSAVCCFTLLITLCQTVWLLNMVSSDYCCQTDISSAEQIEIECPLRACLGTMSQHDDVGHTKAASAEDTIVAAVKRGWRNTVVCHLQ